jgi:glycosyltransferase involved in cell wall biosynthesis
MMHVAFLIPTVDRIGGAEQQVLLLARGLAARGWRVSVVALSGTGGDGAAELRSRNIDFLTLQMRKGLADPRGWIRLHRWIRHNQPDVLHAHLSHAALMARWSRFLAPARLLVGTIHSPATGGALRRLGYGCSPRQADLITAVSRAAAEPWLANGLVQEAQLAVIPNGIDVDRWKPDPAVRRAMRTKLGLGSEFVWLAVGRLDPVKDHATLLQAFAGLPENARLLIAGAGPLESELRQLAAKPSIASRIQFLGFQNDVLPWMQVADAFVLTSRWEGLPLAFLEAAACELPAVCTDIPAIRELAGALPGHALTPIGDCDALATAMQELMRLGEADRRTIGRGMRDLVARRFRIQNVLDQWEEIYRRLLRLRPHPTRSGMADSARCVKTLQLQ